MDTEYRRFTAAEADALADFLLDTPWPFHVPSSPDRELILKRVADHFYDGDDSRTFWIISGGQRAGLLRLLDLTEVGRGVAPMFDLRLAPAHRRQGIGRQTVAWLTEYLFTTFPDLQRIEGNTRQDNLAMRRTFRSCGYVKESHYRAAWPGESGRLHDSIGYAVLRRDWLSGTTTLPDWDDEPS